MSIIQDLLQAAITTVVARLQAQGITIDPAVLTAAVNELESLVEEWTGGDTKARKDAIAALEADANAGNANAWAQIYNWSHSAPAGFPHGNEPSSSLADAQAAWNRLVAAHPTWAAQFTAFSGKPGDSPLDTNGPSLH